MLKQFYFSRPKHHSNNYTFVVVNRNHFINVFLNTCSLRAFFKTEIKKRTIFSTSKFNVLDFSESRSQSSFRFPSKRFTSRTRPIKSLFGTWSLLGLKTLANSDFNQLIPHLYNTYKSVDHFVRFLFKEYLKGLSMENIRIRSNCSYYLRQINYCTKNDDRYIF